MIGQGLGTLAFLNPWILSGLLFLPIIWFLLRVTPPAPKRLFFPASRFLKGLKPEDHTSSKTPWWIILIRLSCAALLIFALAKPVLNPESALENKGAVRIVIDNGWEAAQTWPMQIEEALSVLDRSEREHRQVYIMTTTPDPGENFPHQEGPITAAKAKSLLKGLRPFPWPADYKSASHTVSEIDKTGSIISYWFSAGINGHDSSLFAQSLQNQGSVSVFEPPNTKLPLLIRSAQGDRNSLKAIISAPNEISSGVPVTVEVLGSNGYIIDVQSKTIDSKNLPLEVELNIPEALRNQISQINIKNRKGAGSILILDDQFKRRHVGIVSPLDTFESAPLIEDSYYLERALEPYADLTSGTLKDIIQEDPAVIILPDVGAMPADELNKLETWVKDGGLLLRFAGPNMTQGETYLTPVPLRKGGRALDGALTWQNPVKMAPFPENSPFYGLDIAEDITIKRQMLAEPIDNIDQKTWAILEDGTPLITADSLGQGLLVFIHTTATPDWSNLALSGVYVQILRYIINLSPGKAAQTDVSGQLHPLIILDGNGAVQQPSSFIEPINYQDFETTIPGPTHPPGLYGRSGMEKALNLGDRLGKLEKLASLPLGVSRHSYQGSQEKALWPYFLSIALALFLLDWLIMILMQFSLRDMQPRFTILIVMALLLTTAKAYAQNDIKYAADLYLAYIQSPSSQINIEAHRGLESLAGILTRRTSIEPAGVAALNIEKDTLIFFPFIYWPITTDSENLSDQALRKVQHYLDHGGLIMFDTRDQLSTPNRSSGFTGGKNSQTLKRMMGNLNIAPLAPMPDDHVLTKSFYLLNGFPGRYEGGTIWVEEQSISGKSAVSSIIIGSHDWAGAWGSVASKTKLSGGPQQQEMSLRVGVNIMMYALTGNYKADQVHLPHILERLGQ